MPKFGDQIRDGDGRHNMWCCGNQISLHQSFLFPKEGARLHCIFSIIPLEHKNKVPPKVKKIFASSFKIIL